jgi:hypothetical protein
MSATYESEGAQPGGVDGSDRRLAGGTAADAGDPAFLGCDGDGDAVVDRRESASGSARR